MIMMDQVDVGQWSVVGGQLSVAASNIHVSDVGDACKDSTLAAGDFLAEFEGWLVGKGDRPNTVAQYVRGVRAYANWFRASMREEFRPGLLYGPDVNRWRRETLEAGAIKANTWLARLAALRSFVLFAKEYGHLRPESDPLKDVKGAKKQKLAPQSLARGERGRVLRQANANVETAYVSLEKSGSSKKYEKALRARAVVNLMLNVGLRAQEVANLQIGDLHLSERKGIIEIRNSKGISEGTVAVNKEARSALGDWLARRGPEAGSLFGSSKRTLQRDVEHLAQQCCLEGVSAHKLRHTCAYTLIREGASIEEVGSQLRQLDINTTRRYTLPHMEDLQEAVERQ